MVLRDEICLAAQPDTVAPGKIRGIRSSTRLRRLWRIGRRWVLSDQKLAGRRGNEASESEGDDPQRQLFEFTPGLLQSCYRPLVEMPFRSLTTSWNSVLKLSGQRFLGARICALF